MNESENLEINIFRQDLKMENTALAAVRFYVHLPIARFHHQNGELLTF